MSSTADEKFGPVKNSHEEEYIAVCTVVERSIKICVIGCTSQSIISKYTVTPEDAETFIDSISTMFDPAKCKGILFEIYKFEPASSVQEASEKYPHVINFCFAIRLHLDQMQIKHFFYADKCLFLSRLLISAKLNEPVEDEVIVFLLSKAGENQIYIFEYCFAQNGYEKIRDETVTVTSNVGLTEIRDKIRGEKKMKNIIVCGSFAKSIVKRFKNKEVSGEAKRIFLEKETVESEANALELSKMFREPNPKYHLIPTCAKKYTPVVLGCDVSATINIGDSLPNQTVISGFDDNGENERPIFIDFQNFSPRHYSRYSFIVDSEGFPTLTVQPVICDSIRNLPQQLDNELTKKIPVILIYNNISVICAVKKGEERYSFLDGWNGLYGKDDTVFLHEMNPVFGVRNVFSYLTEEAEKIDLQDTPLRHEEPESAVINLMKKLIEEQIEVIREAIGTPVEEIRFLVRLDTDENSKDLFENRLKQILEDSGLIWHILQLEIPMEKNNSTGASSFRKGRAFDLLPP